MLRRLISQRPKQLLAVYVEPRQVDILRAHRKWRSWQVDSIEQFPVPDNEGIFEFLQRLSLRPRGRGTTALLLLLPRLYYGFHREHYPAALENNLEEALGFDWPENVFQEPEQTFHFFGQAVAVNGHLSVPIYSLRTDIYEKFFQALGGSSFQTFSVVPTAPHYQVFLPDNKAQKTRQDLHIFGRVIDSSRLEIHKFYKGLLLDSTIVRKGQEQFRLFRENLRSLDGTETSNQSPVQLICRALESERNRVAAWQNEDLPVEVIEIEDSPLVLWVDHLLEQEAIETFNPPLLLKPWQVPKAVWMIITVIVLFSAYAFYQVKSYDSLLQNVQTLKKQRTQLEAQWKPIEQLQNRVSKFEQDQQALATFNDQGYPMLGVLTLLTELTPQDTWLNYLSLREGELMLRGESSSAIKYLTELSKIKGFEDVRFASPVTRNPSNDNERFNLQLKLNVKTLGTTLEAIPLEGGVIELPQEAGQSIQPPSSSLRQPDGKGTEGQAMMPPDDNETIIRRSPPAPGDDNQTLDPDAGRS